MSSDFALAQQRIAARRHAREAESQLHQRAHATGSSRLPYPLDQVEKLGAETWQTINGREGTRPGFRVGQVDAELLDEELLQLLKSQVGEGLKYYGSHLQDDWAAEITLALRAIVFKLTVWDHDATYGAALQNLKFTDARSKNNILAPPSKMQKSLYGLFTVGGKYFWTKLGNWLLDKDNGYDEPTPTVRALSRFVSITSGFHSIAAFLSFLVFLVNGRYRTLLDRILKLRLAAATNHVSREVSFEYLNRQLVWHAFTEFLLFMLPLVGISRWRKWLSRAWRRTKALVQTNSDDEDTSKSGELGFLPERTCAICYQDQNSATTEQEVLAASSGVVGNAQTDITNPYETIPCGCVYCFVCLASRLEAEEGDGWTCLRCGELVKECKPWSGDVLEEVAKHSSTKSVGFSDQLTMPLEESVEEHSKLRSPLPESPAEVEDDDSSITGSSEGYEEEEDGDYSE